MSKRLWALLSLLVVASMVLAACGSQPTATATAPATNTSLPTNTSTSAPSPTNSPTATEIPNPGLEELKKIDPLFFDGGAVEFLGRTFDENSHDPEGTRHNTEAYREVILVKHDGYFTLGFIDDRMTVQFLKGTYITWRIPTDVTIDVEEAVSEFQYFVGANADDLLSIAPKGFQYYYATLDESPAPIYQNLPFTVSIDYKEQDVPMGTFMPAENWDELTDNQLVIYQYGAIETFTCKGSTVRTIVFVVNSMFAPCPTVDRASYRIYFGTKETVQQSRVTPTQVRKMWKWMFSQVNVYAEGYNEVELFWSGDHAIGNIMPLAEFDEHHLLPPTPTNTPPATATRTPRPTPTATINMTVTGEVPVSTSTVSCSNNDQDVTYTVTGPLLGTPYCAKGLTYQDEPVDTLVIPGAYGQLLITLDRVGGNGMYAVLIDNVPGAYGTPTFTLTGTSIAAGHAQKTATDDVLEAVMNSGIVTLNYTAGEFTITAEAWLK